MAKKEYPGGFRLTMATARRLAVQEFGTAKGLEPDRGTCLEGFFTMQMGNMGVSIRPDLGIFGWVTDAEKDLGGGTGKLKASKVAAMIYQYIPDDLKPMFTPKEIQDMIDTALAAAKEYWEKNGKAKEYIESGATAMLTAEVDAVKVADGIPVEEVVKAVGAGVSEAIKTAVEAAKAADTAAVVEVTAETEAETTAETKEE